MCRFEKFSFLIERRQFGKQTFKFRLATSGVDPLLPLMDECQIPGVGPKRALLSFQIRSVASRVRW
jgi:hypothetical protein